MKVPDGRRGPATILLLLLLLAAASAAASVQDGAVTPWRVERDARRLAFVAGERFMELLALRPGMTVLDIGAGTGQFAFEFARRVGAAGTVWATDTQQACVDYMKEEAARRGLPNLRPVRVSREGLDGFYRGRRYDLVTLFHVSMPYEERLGYFRELRPCVAEGGRLVLVLEKVPAPFSAGDFTGDLGSLAREILREPPEGPFARAFGEGGMRSLREGTGAPSAELLARGFNRAMADPGLALPFLDGAAFRREVDFTAEERVFAEWLLLSFRDRSVFLRDPGTLNGAGALKIAQVNKLLTVQRFRKHLRPERMFLSPVTPGVKEVFRKAGFRLDREEASLVPFETVAVFSAA